MLLDVGTSVLLDVGILWLLDLATCRYQWQHVAANRNGKSRLSLVRLAPERETTGNSWRAAEEARRGPTGEFRNQQERGNGVQAEGKGTQREMTKSEGVVPEEHCA